MKNVDVNIKIYRAKSRFKKGWAAWFIKDGSKRLPGYYKTKAEAVARGNELIRARNVESAVSKNTYDEVATEVVSRYQKRFEKEKIKFTAFKDAGEAQKFWAKYFTNKAMNSITVQDIEAAIDDAFSRRAPKTVKNRWAFLRKVFARAVQTNRAVFDSTSTISLVELIGSSKAIQKKARQISKSVISEILDNAGHYKLVLKFACRTGMRSGEVRALKWCNVDLDSGFVTVDPEFGAAVLEDKQLILSRPKTPAAARNIPISDELVRELRAHKLISPYSKENDFVFPNQNGGIMHPNRLNGEVRTVGNKVVYKGAVKPACHKAGVEPIRFHDLRHHYASLQLARPDVSLIEVARLMGHESSKITEEIYGHWLDGDSKDQSLRARAAI
mgnify:CR=1 FL=1